MRKSSGADMFSKIVKASRAHTTNATCIESSGEKWPSFGKLSGGNSLRILVVCQLLNMVLLNMVLLNHCSKPPGFVLQAHTESDVTGLVSVARATQAIYSHVPYLLGALLVQIMLEPVKTALRRLI